MKKYTLLAMALLVPLLLILVGCNSGSDLPTEEITTLEEPSAALPTEEPTTEEMPTEEPTTEEITTEEMSTEEMSTEEIPTHTGDYSKPY